MMYAIRVDLETGTTETIGESTYGAMVAGWTPDHSRVVSRTSTMGDIVLYELDANGDRQVLFGTPLDERERVATTR